MTLPIPFANVIIENNIITDGYATTDGFVSSKYTYDGAIFSTADAKIKGNTLSGISNNTSNNLLNLEDCSCIVTDNVFIRNTSNINAYVNSTGSKDHIITDNIFDYSTVDGSDSNVGKGITSGSFYTKNKNQTEIPQGQIPIIFSGPGRIVPSVTLGANFNTTYVVGNSNNVIRVTSAVTSNVGYQLSATNAITNDIITIYCEPDFNFAVNVTDQSSNTLFALGNGDFSEGPWASFIYIGGWRLLQSPASKTRQQIFNYTGSTQFWPCPRGVYQVTLIGWGGGGGGAGGRSAASDDATVIPRGGGGGAGAIKHTVTVAVTPNNVYSIGVGAAGTFGTPNTNGGDGQITTFFGSDVSVVGFLGGGGGKCTIQTGDNNNVSIGGGYAFAEFDYIFGDAFIPTAQIGGASGNASPSATSVGRAGGSSAQYFGGPGGGNGINTGDFKGGGGGGGGGGGPGGEGKGGGGGGNSQVSPTAGGDGGSADPGSGAGGGGGGGGGNGGSGGTKMPGGNGGYGGTGRLTIIWTK